jgi:predicted permease
MPLLRRLWFMLRRDRLDAELKREMDWHLEQRTRELVDAGMDERSARQAARRAFGNPTRLREESRQIWSLVTLDLIAHDVRHAVRTLARQPLLALIAVLSLGSAMAAAAAVFSLADAVLFETLPVPEPGRLVLFKWVSGPDTFYQSLDGWSSSNDREASSTSFSYDAFRAARDAGLGRADVFGFADLYQVAVASGAEPEVATAQVVSGNYYAALGVRPAAGRLIEPADDRPEAAEPAVVISHAFWRRVFGERPDAVGSTLRINGIPAPIVGVAARGFNGTRQVGETADVTLPLALRDRIVRQPGDQLAPTDPRYWWVIMMARLAPNEAAASVQPALEVAVRQTIQAASPDAAGKPFRVDLLPGSRGMLDARDELTEPIGLMAGIVVLVVLIACANLASLLLARGAARDREIALRLALGASRGHIVRQLLIESVVLGVLAGAAALIGTRWIAEGLLPALSLEPIGIDLALDGRGLAFTGAAAIACALMFGLVPAWRASGVSPVRGIKDGAAGNRVPRLRLARAVLVAQVALSVVVLVAAGLLVHTLRNLERVDPGFDPRGVLTFRVDPTLNGYDEDRIRTLYAALLERLRALPGVEHASFSHHGLLYGWSSRSTVQAIDGRPPSPQLDVNRLIVEQDFFRTMRIPLVAGSQFSGLERPGQVRSVVINETFARQGFKTAAPLGRRFRLGTRPEAPTYEVHGVVKDAHIVRLRDEAPPTAYFSFRQEITFGAVFALRASGDPGALAGAVRRTVAEVDPDVPVERLRTQDAQVAFSLRRERLFAMLASALGGLALLLACIGLYGLMAYAVSRRTPEIGIRMALGAERRRVLLMIVGDAARLTAVGLAAGVAGALLASRYLESLLFGLTPTDPGAQALAVALLALVTLTAAYVPARRASRVDPLVALKYE